MYFYVMNQFQEHFEATDWYIQNVWHITTWNKPVTVHNTNFA
jgi:hypothetical protein